ncbi:hypothetical protein LPJ72_002476 [Coemansia sp. Benny D160-2]|nr:hypothetical protein LPJ72_002476 [Coemansia sp. Benny D160-2]
MERKVVTQELSLERSLIQDVAKALLHTIIFHRYFGNVTPKSNTILSSAVTYASVDNTEVLRTVDEKVAELMQAIPAAGEARTRVSLHFTETKPRRKPASAWFGKTSGLKSKKGREKEEEEEEVCWEEWAITINSKVARTERERNQMLASAQDQAKDALFLVIAQADTHKDHIPLIADPQGNPFPYHITIAPGAGLWSSMIKRAILPGIS